MCLCASACVPPSMSILDQCEREAAVIKRIRCFSDVRCWALCVFMCLAVQTYTVNVHKADAGQTVCMVNQIFGSSAACESNYECFVFWRVLSYEQTPARLLCGT